MIVIAESGSTKTDWRLIPTTGSAAAILTIGLNPFYVTEERFSEILAKSGITQWPEEEIDQVFFYSAGITDNTIQGRLKKWLTGHFRKAKVSVESDSLAAARAVYGSKSGVFGILGTGSNSGYYDGEKIAKSISPLGYILGDEGSGNALGKKLVKEYLRNNLSQELTDEFQLFYEDYQNLLTNIYSNQRASQLLASFVPFIAQHLDNEFINSLVRAEFERYFDILAGYGKIEELALVGSIAYYFESIIQEVATERGIAMGKVLKSPIEALTLFHQQQSL